MLFQDRLGHVLYRPIGLDWFQSGYWKINDQEDTARQFLEPFSIPTDGTPPLNDDLSMCVLFSQFSQMRFDVLIASLPQHIEPFKELIRLYQPTAKLIYQIGNQWQVNPKEVKNVMASAKVQIPENINGVIYHQEFDINTFRYEPPIRDRKIYSFVNCLNTADLFRDDWSLFLQLEQLMPEWEFKSFGGQCRDGNMTGSQALADKMREASFIFHCKSGGDGYGHVIHNAASVGRPFIIRQTDYFDKLAQPLIDQAPHILVNYGNIKDKPVKQIAEEIQGLYDHETQYLRVCEVVNQVFKRNVDFDKEEQKILKFLDNLQ